MATVDPADDSVLRYIVRHYRFDPERHERRHVEVAAYDNETEFMAAFDAHRSALDERRRAGDVDPREHISGMVKEPGYAVRQRQRLPRRADEGPVRELMIRLGTVDVDECATLSLVARPDDSAEGTDIRFVVEVDGQPIGGGSGSAMFDPYNVIACMLTPKGREVVYGTVGMECIEASCDGTRAEIFHPEGMNAAFFMALVPSAPSHVLVFEGPDGWRHGRRIPW